MQRNLDHVYKNWGCYPSLANSICQFFMFQWWNLGGQIGWYYHRGCDQINCPIFDVVCNRFSKSDISDGSKKSKISKMCSSTGKKKFFSKKNLFQCQFSNKYIPMDLDCIIDKSGANFEWLYSEKINLDFLTIRKNNFLK